ncbi:Detected protein of unknown function [Hibiscus syriacus]|uniref:Uncharacterized protein n=1 Tax=Hibiscus syriacus TaxID=106335 RepID=A0A6A2WZI9_HIBSY|nr:Detected protein of unknown function [Hibiscus syriacus]
MFLMNYTRPDIAYAVSRLSRYTHNPSGEHWIALKRLLKYLKGTLDWKLEFIGFPAILEEYCDANWVSDNDEVSSTSGYVFTLGGAAISWKSSKQTCIARSTMESEFIALDLAGQEAEWLRSLLADIPLWGRPTPPVSLLCDSQAAICVAKNQAYNGKKRHIRIRQESVRRLIKNGVLSLEYVKSERNLADTLTKGLGFPISLLSDREQGGLSRTTAAAIRLGSARGRGRVLSECFSIRRAISPAVHSGFGYTEFRATVLTSGDGPPTAAITHIGANSFLRQWFLPRHGNGPFEDGSSKDTCTGSQIIPSIYHLSSQKMGYCERFHVERFVEDLGSAEQGGKKLTKTLMYFEGCPNPLGCSILLRGANGDELKKTKHVVQYGIFAVYLLALETSFLADEGASLPGLPLDNPISASFMDKPSIISRSISTFPGFSVPSDKMSQDHRRDNNVSTLPNGTSLLSSSSPPLEFTALSSSPSEKVIPDAFSNKNYMDSNVS